MQQTTLNRGHLAFIADQVHAAEEAFKTNELDDCATILKSVQMYIDRFLIEAEKPRQ